MPAPSLFSPRIFVAVAVCFVLAPAAAFAEGTVEMELATEQGFQPTETQKWYRTLTDLGVGGLTIRGAKAGDVVKVETTGSEKNPVYRVRGLLNRQGQLVVPGGKFGPNETTALKKWIDELKTWGPQGAPQDKPLYGLNAEQYAALRSDFSTGVAFSTAEMTGREAIDKLTQSLRHKVALSPAAAEAITAEDRVGTDLQGLATGTALAYAIRPYGLVLRPERLTSGEVVVAIKPTKEVPDPWPIGASVEKRDVDAVPKLLDKLKVEIEPTPLGEVLPVIVQRLETRYLVDRNSLFKHDVDLATVKVSFAKRETWYKNILGDLLRQAGLKSEVRLDDAGKPFFWITTTRP